MYDSAIDFYHKYYVVIDQMCVVEAYELLLFLHQWCHRLHRVCQVVSFPTKCICVGKYGKDLKFSFPCSVCWQLFDALSFLLLIIVLYVILLINWRKIKYHTFSKSNIKMIDKSNNTPNRNRRPFTFPTSAVIGTNCTSKFNYYTITTTAIPYMLCCPGLYVDRMVS
jgi:hypothetical protein